MKKGMMAFICLIIGIMICACGSRNSANTNQQTAAPVADASITFRNHAEDADVWILPPDSVAGTRCTLWTPLSYFILE